MSTFSDIEDKANLVDVLLSDVILLAEFVDLHTHSGSDPAAESALRLIALACRDAREKVADAATCCVQAERESGEYIHLSKCGD